MAMFRPILRGALIVWAMPWTLAGCLIGLLGCLSGGGAQFHSGILEFYGGGVTWLLKKGPIQPSAMTLGHVVLGRSVADLDRARAHELVHVRQYERWGPFFIPAYLTCSLWLWLRKRDFYRDNPFEKEAYEKAPLKP